MATVSRIFSMCMCAFGGQPVWGVILRDTVHFSVTALSLSLMVTWLDSLGLRVSGFLLSAYPVYPRSLPKHKRRMWRFILFCGGVKGWHMPPYPGRGQRMTSPESLSPCTSFFEAGPFLLFLQLELTGCFVLFLLKSQM